MRNNELKIQRVLVKQTDLPDYKYYNITNEFFDKYSLCRDYLTMCLNFNIRSKTKEKTMMLVEDLLKSDGILHELLKALFEVLHDCKTTREIFIDLMTVFSYGRSYLIHKLADSHLSVGDVCFNRDRLEELMFFRVPVDGLENNRYNFIDHFNSVLYKMIYFQNKDIRVGLDLVDEYYDRIKEIILSLYDLDEDENEFKDLGLNTDLYMNYINELANAIMFKHFYPTLIKDEKMQPIIWKLSHKNYIPSFNCSGHSKVTDIKIPFTLDEIPGSSMYTALYAPYIKFEFISNDENDFMNMRDLIDKFSDRLNMSETEMSIFQNNISVLIHPADASTSIHFNEEHITDQLSKGLTYYEILLDLHNRSLEKSMKVINDFVDQLPVRSKHIDVIKELSMKIKEK